METASRPAHPPRPQTLTPEDERRLARLWLANNDHEALGTLVRSHLGLVVRIALEFRFSGPPLEDLIQEGNLGLTIAARRFDPARSTRLATYATYWIRACILEHVVRSHGPVRIGTTRSQRKIFFGLGRARRLLERGGAQPSTGALAGLLGVAPEEIEEMAPRLSGHDISIDSPRSTGGDGEGPQLSAILAEDRLTPEELVATTQETSTQHQLLFTGLEALDPRERMIIRARYLQKRPATLAALGKKFRISRERVRQLELRAKHKLRQFCTQNERCPPIDPGLETQVQ